MTILIKKVTYLGGEKFFNLHSQNTIYKNLPQFNIFARYQGQESLQPIC